MSRSLRALYIKFTYTRSGVTKRSTTAVVNPGRLLLLLLAKMTTGKTTTKKATRRIIGARETFDKNKHKYSIGNIDAAGFLIRERVCSTLPLGYSSTPE